MSRPVIGVTAYAHMIDDTFRAQICGDRTPLAVAAVAGGLPLILPGMPDAASTGELVELLDGLVLTGARPNVHPEYYGEAETEAHGPFDRGRDGLTLPLIRAMIEAGKPVFGICRGMQLINVAYGGTLYQDIDAQIPAAQRHVDTALYDELVHEVRFVEDSLLAQTFGTQGPVPVTSIHHQCVRRVGEGLSVHAYSVPDNLVEAVTADSENFVMGVQWHPEFHPSRQSQVLDCAPLLEVFIQAAERARDSRLPVA